MNPDETGYIPPREGPLYTSEGLPMTAQDTFSSLLLSTGKQDSFTPDERKKNVFMQDRKYLAAGLLLLTARGDIDPQSKKARAIAEQALVTGYELLTQAAQTNAFYARVRASDGGKLESVEEVIDALRERLGREEVEAYIGPLAKFQEQYEEALMREAEIRRAALGVRRGLEGTLGNDRGALSAEEHASLLDVVREMADSIHSTLNLLTQAAAAYIGREKTHRETVTALMGKVYLGTAELVRETNKAFNRCDLAEERLEATEESLKKIAGERDMLQEERALLNSAVDALCDERDELETALRGNDSCNKGGQPPASQENEGYDAQVLLEAYAPFIDGKTLPKNR